MQLQLTEAQYSLLRDEARRRGVSMSELIRAPSSSGRQASGPLISNG